MNKILLIGCLLFTFLTSCELVRNVSTNKSKSHSKTDTTTVSYSATSQKNTKDSVSKEDGAVSRKSEIRFTLNDSSKQPINIKNYMPTGNNGIDFLGQLAAMGLLKDGSITTQDDSTYQRYQRLFQEKLLAEKKYDSLAAAKEIEEKNKQKETERKIEFSAWWLLAIAFVLYVIWKEFLVKKYTIVKKIIP